MIEVVAYRDDWPTRFEQLRAAYAAALDGSGVEHRVEHVGSTAVPGLAAKPVIDIDIIVAESDVGAATAALAAIGFVALGDLGVAGRAAFTTPERFAPSNTYVVAEGSLPLTNHLAVRDTLRRDPGLRLAYDRVKRDAAATAGDIGEYLRLKSAVLERVLLAAGVSAEDRRAIAATNRGIASRGPRG